MYSTYDGAKKRSYALHAALREAEVDVSLTSCQHALARGGGYQTWHHLRRVLANGTRRPAQLDGFLDRASLAMPTQAVGPTRRWVEVELDRLDPRDRDGGGDRWKRHWNAKEWEFVFASGVMHRATTALLRPGSGRGQRLREEMVCYLCMGPIEPDLDRATLRLTFKGRRSELFRETFKHPHFMREFARLTKAGILEWRAVAIADESGEGVLILSPPPPDLVRNHIRKCREVDAEYWRANADPPPAAARLRGADGATT